MAENTENPSRVVTNNCEPEIKQGGIVNVILPAAPPPRPTTPPEQAPKKD
jgi:hypothetical protein